MKEMERNQGGVHAVAEKILTTYGGDMRNKKCRCPHHNGEGLTLSVGVENGKLLVHCFRGCTQDEVISALRRDGLWPGTAVMEGEQASAAAEEARSPEARLAYALEIRRALEASKGFEFGEALADYFAGRGIETVPDTAMLAMPGYVQKDVPLRKDSPGMVLTFWDKAGEIKGVQVTWLAFDLLTKRDTKPVRQTYGLPAGGFLDLSTDLDFKNPPEKLLIGEGAETVLSAMQLTGLLGIAAGGKVAYVNKSETVVHVDPPRCGEYIILCDVDDSGGSRKAAGLLAQRLIAAGSKVRIAMPVRPKGGKPGYDWNDALVDVGDDEAKCAELKQAILEAPPFDEIETDAEKADFRIHELAALWIRDKLAAQIACGKEAKSLGLTPTSMKKEVERRGDAMMKTVQAMTAPMTDVETGGRFSAPNPWPEPVNGDELLQDLYDIVARHIVLPNEVKDEARVALALWVLHAYALDAASHSPILDISSPTWRCGKSQLLDLLQKLVPKPLPGVNITKATVFRMVEQWSPTLLIDEADTFLKENDELRGILNSGHKRSMAIIPRCVGDDNIVKLFSTWCAKAIAHIGRIHSTLEDRSIRIPLRRKLKSERVDPLPTKDDAYDDIRRKCARFATDNLAQLKEASPSIPSDINDRAADNWRPLFAIADVCHEEWGEIARNAALELSGVDDDESNSIVLLRDLRDIFEREKLENSETVAMSSAEIAMALGEMEDRNWPEYRHGKPITPTQIAKLLKPFGITSRKVTGGAGRQLQGYRFDQFGATFKRYLDPLPVLDPLAPLSSVKSKG
jgi:hypothetical protein